ncbi:hypothetical protein [Peribacillus glennii]|uniref:Uncharacterized protein n=1 Tax=Peribacillus glennii TaxID=2303991 RepID=A0A372LCV9_9BACI|nr:hypothetical protein [Peribacillus glennii]RFU63453.1 hypothetical protein D0466_12030 [Peribacillus glennii]
MRNERIYEILLIPSNLGLIRIHISGFETFEDSGEVVAVLNDLVVKKRGYYKRRIILKTFMQLNKLIAHQ